MSTINGPAGEGFLRDWNGNGEWEMQTGREPTYTIGKPVMFWRNGGRYNGYYGNQPNYTAWVETLFPTVPPPAREAAKPPKPSDTWSPEAIALAKSLLRTESLKKLDGGIDVREVTETFDPRWNRRSSHHANLALNSPKAWLTRTLNLDAQTIVNFCDAKERGAFSLSLLLGRVRKSIDRDLSAPPLDLSDWSLSPLDVAYRAYQAHVVKADAPNQVVLVLRVKGSDAEQRFLIDTKRHVLLKIETVNKKEMTSTVSFTDFVEIAGSWWARRVTTTDSKQRKIGETSLDIKSLAADKYNARMATELTAKDRVQFLHLPLVRFKDAQQHVADGSASFDDRIVMMLHDAYLQQWDAMLSQLDAIEKAAAGNPGVAKPGVHWIRPMILQTIRRNDESRQLWLGEARKLVENKQQDELFLAGFLLGQAASVTSPAEYLEFVELLKPVYDRQPAELDATTSWQQILATTYDRLGRIEEMLAVKQKLAANAPWEVSKQTDYAQRLMQAGQADVAYDWLRKQLDRKVERENSEDESLRTAYANLYRGQARWEDLLRFTSKWIDRKPEYESAYLQHLSALVYNDRLDDANALALQWLKESQIKGKLAPDQDARLSAAISFAEGNAYDISFNRMDERWFEPFAQAARFFIHDKEHVQIVSRLMDYRFSESDSADRLRGYFLKLLETESAKLSPEQINLLVNWTLSGASNWPSRSMGASNSTPPRFRTACGERSPINFAPAGRPWSIKATATKSTC